MQPVKVDAPPAEAPASQVIGVMCMVPFFIIYGYFVLTDIPMLITTAFTNIREVLGLQPMENPDTYDDPRPDTVQSNWSDISLDISSQYPIE